MCFADRMCPCMVTNSEGEVRLQRVMLSQALQVFPHILNSTSWVYLIFFATVSVCVCRSKVFSSVQESLGKLMINKRLYGDRDDFAVIMQDSPFLSDMSIISVSQTLTVIVCLHLFAPLVNVY